ncbi:MAG: helix-turn-helix domain-containing protein [Bacteroidales bacterium]|nr:helix-turn-helix domain-containing protein [Bacteroidales bacterium]
MLNVLILFLPAVACFFWIAVLAMTASRTRSFLTSVCVLLATGLYLVTDAFYAAPNIPIRILIVTALLAQIAAPSVIPLVLLHLRTLRRQEGNHISYYLWLILPVVLFTAGILLSDLSGPDRIEEFLLDLYTGGNGVVDAYKGTPVKAYYVWTVLVYRGVVIVEMVVLLIYIVKNWIKHHFGLKHLRSFFKEGGKISVAEMQVYIFLLTFLVFPFKALMVKDAIVSNIWLWYVSAILLTVIVFLFGFTCLFGAKREITLQEMRNSMRFNYNASNKADIVEEMIADLVEDAETEALRRIQGMIEENLEIDDIVKVGKAPTSVSESLFSAVANSWDDDSLLSRFQSLMLNEKLFLQPGLSLVEVSEKLNSNKTYVSKMVNNTYNLGFPELINTLRIDYAEEYILSHRNAKQEEIAAACGFISASSFNNTFKKITGVTPKVWVANRDRK